MSITQTITALPAAPNPASDTPAQFSTKAAAFVLAQTGLPTEINLWAAQANTLAATVNADAATASAAEVAAVAAAASAAASAGVTKWVSGTTYAQGACVWSPANFQTYRRTTNGAGTVDPSADAANWQAITTSGATQPVGSTIYLNQLYGAF